MNATTIGIDLAKNTFHLCAMDARGRVLWRRREGRAGLLRCLRPLPPCRVVMEACGGSHYWAREIAALGHEAKLVSGQFVKPFVKSNKNDVCDAEAICEAGSRPTMRFVPVKTVHRQDIQALHRRREQLLKFRTALSNQIRGLLLENGIPVAAGRPALHRALPALLDTDDGRLTALFRELLRGLAEHLQSLTQRLQAIDAQLTRLCHANEATQRLLEVPGIGPLTATALFAAVGTGADFENGRHMAAWLGLVPRQYTTGGKPRLLGISKRGDHYLRKLFIHGARSVLIAPTDLGRTPRWARAVQARTCTNKAAVGLANKNARITWALLHRGEHYRHRAAGPGGPAHAPAARR